MSDPRLPDTILMTPLAQVIEITGLGMVAIRADLARSSVSCTRSSAAVRSPVSARA